MIREHWITGAFLVLLIFAALTAHAGAWYSSDWDYRKEITVNNTGSELTNYQVMFTVNRSSGTDSGTTVYLNGKCEEDYDDIRFVGADDTTAWDYWIESSSATVATIWVEVPSLPTGDTTGYLYYGNSGASAGSDGDATFPVFDHFLGSTLGDEWTSTLGAGLSISDSIATMTNAATDQKGIYHDNSYGTNYAFRAKAKYADAAWPEIGWDRRLSGGGSEMVALTTNGNTHFTTYSSDGTPVSNNIVAFDANYHIFECIRNGSTSVIGYVDSSTATVSTHIPTNSMPLMVSVYADVIYVDWILLRKYTATEPTVSAWGSEEVLPTVAAFSANVTTGNAPLHVGFTDASTGVGLSNWTWDFQNDDTPDSYDQNPAFTYTIAGVYTVNLTVTGTGGTDSEIKVDYITVTNATPTPTPTPTVTPTGTPPVQEEIPEGHLTPLAFVVLAFMVCGLTVYTFADNQNRNYLYIATAAVAMIVSFLLGIFLQVGTVSVDFVNTLDEVTVNESVLSTYDVQRVAITDLGFGWFFIFWGVVMLIITILAVIELFREPQRRYEE